MGVWDKTTPIGSDPKSQGDDRIREAKAAIEEALQGGVSEGDEAIFPGSSPSTSPVFHYRGLKGATGSRPASGQYGLYFDTTRGALQRDNGSTWDDIGMVIPSGAVMDYAGAIAPNDWLLCDGAVVSRTIYAALFSAIGTIFGVGDGSTTFQLPNACGRSTIGVGTGSGLTARALADVVGTETHTLSVSEIPSGLTVNDPGHVHKSGHAVGIAVAGGTSGPFLDTDNDTRDTASATTGISVGGGNGAHNNMQPSLVLNKIIKI